MFCLSVFSVFDFSASRVVSSEFLVRKEKGLYFLDAFSFCFYPFLKPSPQRTFLTRIQQWSTNALIHCVSSRSCSAGGVAGGLTLCWQPTKPPARMLALQRTWVSPAVLRCVGSRRNRQQGCWRYEEHRSHGNMNEFVLRVCHVVRNQGQFLSVRASFGRHSVRRTSWRTGNRGRFLKTAVKRL